jgi:ArsR family transcriptional regulator, arsenate/arsenite/antimonite-responsive transcriptional repressor
MAGHDTSRQAARPGQRRGRRGEPAAAGRAGRGGESLRPALLAMETVLRALADQTRLRILGLLMAGETCVCNIHASLQVPQPTASRHLAYLRRAGLVDTRRQGLWVYYRLASPADALLQSLLDCAVHCLSHLPSTGADLRRLGAETGTSPEPEVPGSAYACCGGSHPVTLVRRTGRARKD